MDIPPDLYPGGDAAPAGKVWSIYVAAAAIDVAGSNAPGVGGAGSGGIVKRNRIKP